MKHAALNTETAEVLVCSSVNALKRRVAQNVRWNIRHGYGAGKWIFAHGKTGPTYLPRNSVL